MENKILAFCHIPKNAGSLITYLLRSRFGPVHCRVISSTEVYDYRDLKSDLRVYPSLRAISGHPLRPFSDFKELENRLVWAVLLRDPYSRFPSQYKWWCKQNHSNITFEEWCEKKGDKFSNFQCKWIGRSADHQIALEVIQSKNIIVGFQSDIRGFLLKIAQATEIKQLPWDDGLVINATSTSSSKWNQQLIERYNAEDILLYKTLLAQEKVTSKEEYDWTRSFNVSDKINYYLNLVKHVGLYKPYRIFTLRVKQGSQ